jgi:ABC-2 type transport system permease protein
MAIAWALARLQLLKLARSGIKSGRPVLSLRAIRRPLLLLAVGGFVAANLYALAVSWLSTNALARTVAIILFQPALLAAGSAVTLLIVFYALSSLTGAFTERGDLRFLLLAPVRPSIVVGERLLLGSLGFSGVLLIALPACYAVGTTAGVPPAFYLAVVAAMLLLPVAPVSLGALLLMAILRWVPPSRVQSATAAIGTIFSAALYIGLQSLGRSGPGNLPSLPSWLPSTWPGRFVAAVALGDGATAARYGFLALALAAVLFATATAVGARVLVTGSAGYGEIRARRGGARRQQERRTPVEVIAGESRLRPQWWTLMAKDMLVLRRSPAVLVALVYPLAIVGFTAFRFISGPTRGVGRALGNGPGTGTVVFLTCMLVVLLASSVVPGAVNREGKAMALLALAPVSTADIVEAKWIGAGVIPLVIVETALVGLSIHFGLSPDRILLLAVIMLVLLVALTGTTLAANFAWPKLDATNPRRQASGAATFAGLISDVLITLFSGGMVALALLVWHGMQTVVALLVVFLVLVALIVIAAWLNERLLNRLLSEITTMSYG